MYAADFRIRTSQSADVSVTGSIPFTVHSGVCGVAGNYIQMTSDFVLSVDQSVTGIISSCQVFNNHNCTSNCYQKDENPMKRN